MESRPTRVSGCWESKGPDRDSTITGATVNMKQTSDERQICSLNGFSGLIRLRKHFLVQLFQFNIAQAENFGTQGAVMGGRLGAEGVHNNGRQREGFRLQGVFPPGPNDLESWARVLAEVPSLEPAFCREAAGVAWWLDATAARPHRLRVLGNGVVPLAAAHAFRTLAARVKR